ncbi:bacterial Ig-like domain-containing protein [Acholeplasma sp. OttesenSCG-928-E16]|nr:bacterial Ig-like domain-containing protein [Acholeplasma sp. OttesenSCG-928-E16]
MASLAKRSSLVVEGKEYKVQTLLETLIYLPSKEVVSFFNDIGLTIPRQVRIDALIEALELPVARTIEERKTLADELSYRLSIFHEYGETQLENLLVFFSDKAVDKDYLEQFWLHVLHYMITKGVGEDKFTELFRISRNYVRLQNPDLPNAAQFNTEINSLFFDREGRIDGLTPNKFRPVLYKGATLVELRNLGTKYGVEVPRRIKKNELAKIIIEELKERDEYTPELGEQINKMPVVMMQRYAKDNDIKASTELKKEEVIEYILENATETKETYFEPSSSSAYESIVEDLDDEQVDDVIVPTMTVIADQDSASNELLYIEVISKPNKLSYIKNERLDLDGMVVMAFYEDGSRKTLTKNDYKVSNFNSSVSGDEELTITYENKVSSFMVKIVDSEPVMLNIEVVSRPNKVTYLVNEPLDINGLVVYATYDNGMQKPVPNSELSLSGFDNSKIGFSPVIVKYNGFITRFEVQIASEKPNVVGIEIVNVPLKTVYLPAEDFILTGLVVDALFDNGDRVEIDNKDLVIDGFDNGGVGDYDCVVSYAGFEAHFSVVVKEAGPEVIGISIETLPNKLEYYSYDYIDLTGIEVMATYSNGESLKVNLDDLEVFGFDTTAIGKIEITILYEGNAAHYDVIMKETDLSVLEIVIKTLPHRFSYQPYEALDVTGLEVEAVFQGDRRAIIDNSKLSFTGFDSSILGVQSVIVDYEGKNAYFDVEVEGDLTQPLPIEEEPIVEEIEDEIVEEIEEQPVERVVERVERVVAAQVDNTEVVNELKEIRKSLDDLIKITILLNNSSASTKVVEAKENIPDDVALPEHLKAQQEEREEKIAKEEKKKDQPVEIKAGKKVLKFFMWVGIILLLIILLFFAYVMITTALDAPTNNANPFDNFLNNWKIGSKGFMEHLRAFFRMLFGKK